MLASVVLGFQVTAWNEARQDWQEAQQLIARVGDELDESLQLIEYEIPISQRAIEATRIAHEMLVNGQVDESTRSEFESRFVYASRLSEVRLHKSALEVFENSNAANSATSPSLRQAIARYYEYVLIEREQEMLLLNDYATLFRELLDQIDIDGDYFETLHLRGDLSALNENPVLGRTLLQIHLRHQFQLIRLETVRSRIIELREQIQAEQTGGSEPDPIPA